MDMEFYGVDGQDARNGLVWYAQIIVPVKNVKRVQTLT